MRDAMKMQELKRRIEWPLMIAVLATLLALGAMGCADDPLTAPAAVQILPAEVTQQEQEQDAGERAAERQRDKNARSNGSAAVE